MLSFLCAIIIDVQGGSIKPLLRFGGRFFRIGIRFENNSKLTVVYVILTVYTIFALPGSSG